MLLFITLFDKFIIIRLVKLVIIEMGKRINKISIILKFSINKKGVPNTNTPTPIIDCKAIMMQK